MFQTFLLVLHSTYIQLRRRKELTLSANLVKKLCKLSYKHVPKTKDKSRMNLRQTSGLPRGGGLFNPSPEIPNFLTKLSRIPCSVENTSLTT
jgi:hypothetical protein